MSRTQSLLMSFEDGILHSYVKSNFFFNYINELTDETATDSQIFGSKLITNRETWKEGIN